MTPRTIARTARAKINLSLHVVGQRPDGYHELDSLVGFADVHDVIRVADADSLSLHVSGPRAEGVPTGDSNLVMKAARAMNARKCARIELEKHLPAAAGIGGGSADAAATLLALAELWECDLPDNLVSLGADVPVCLAPSGLRMAGIGDVLSPVPAFPDVWAVLINPGVDVPTPTVFKALSCKENAPMADSFPEWQGTADFIDWLKDQRNDLEPPAIACAPVIQEVLGALSTAELARMSGSGATCFGVLKTEADALGLAAELQQAHPQWWVRATRIS